MKPAPEDLIAGSWHSASLSATERFCVVLKDVGCGPAPSDERVTDMLLGLLVSCQFLGTDFDRRLQEAKMLYETWDRMWKDSRAEIEAKLRGRRLGTVVQVLPGGTESEVSCVITLEESEPFQIVDMDKEGQNVPTTTTRPPGA